MSTSNVGESSSSAAEKQISPVAAAATIAEKKVITLKSEEGEAFEVELQAAIQSETVKNLVEDCTKDMVFPLPNVSGPVLAKVIEFSNRHAAAEEKRKANPEEKAKDEELAKFNEEFVKVDQNMLFDLILAANYLNHKVLLDLTCQAVADMLKGKSPDEVRKIFHIKNDYTKEEEEEIRRENSWAFE